MNTERMASTIPAPLPRLQAPETAEAIVAKLDAAAKRGKLAGFSTRGVGPHTLFEVTDFGGPFESILSARVTPGELPTANNTTLEFTTRLRQKLAWVYLVVLIITVWPGVWLTDSMLRTYFTGYDYQTWMWYLPLTAPFVPWGMWTSIKKSRKSGHTAAAEIVGEIAGVLGAKVMPDATSRA